MDDFCFNSLDNPTGGLVIAGVGDLSFSQGLDFVYTEGSVIGLICNTSSNNLLRIILNNNLDTAILSTNLGDIDGNISNPYNIKIVEDNENWHAFVTSLNGNIVRLDFGNSILNIPTATDLGNLSTWGQLQGIDVVEDNEEWQIIVTSYNTDQISVISLGINVTNIPLSGDVLALSVTPALVSGPSGISVIKENNSWYSPQVLK